MIKLLGIFSGRIKSQHKAGAIVALLALAVAIVSGCGGVGFSGSGTADTISPTFAGAKGYAALASSITLSWSPASDNITAAQNIVYQIYRSTAAGGENYTTPTFTSAAGALSYNDTGLTVGSTYYYVVRAMDEAGNIDSNIVEMKAVPDSIPPVFGGITSATTPAAQSAIPAGSVSTVLGWAAATDNVTLQGSIVYLVYRSTTTTMNYATPTATTAAGVTTFIDTGLAQGTKYYYVVRAKDQAGNIDTNTVQLSTTTLVDTTAPTSPLIATFLGATGAATQSSSSIAVGWNAATDNVSQPSSIVYLVYRSTSNGFTPSSTTLITTTAAGALSFTDSGLSASTPYYYVVRAKDEAGNIDTNTVQVSATTNAVSSDTTPPTFAGASSLTLPSTTSITVSWSAASDNVTSAANMVYLVYRATASGGENFAVPTATTAAGATSYTDTGLTAGTKYYYVVRAKDQAGNIDSNTVEVFGPIKFGSDIYTPLISGTCVTGCHSAASKAGGLDLSTQANAYANTVNVASGEVCSPALKYVLPGSSASSYLVDKLSGSLLCGSPSSPMPKNGNPFTATQLNTVKAWIDQGALNN